MIRFSARQGPFSRRQAGKSDPKRLARRHLPSSRLTGANRDRPLYLCHENDPCGSLAEPIRLRASFAAFFFLAYCAAVLNAQDTATTADFKAMVERHMSPQMDLKNNHRMDWFFNQYVYGFLHR